MYIAPVVPCKNREQRAQQDARRRQYGESQAVLHAEMSRRVEAAAVARAAEDASRAEAEAEARRAEERAAAEEAVRLAR